MKKILTIALILSLAACQKDLNEKKSASAAIAEVATIRDSVKFDSSIHFDVYITPGTRTSFFCSFNTFADTSFLKEVILVFKQRSNETFLSKARLFIDHNMVDSKLITSETDTIRFAWKKAVAIPYTGYQHWMYVNIIGFGSKDSSFKIDLIAAHFLRRNPEIQFMKTINLPQPGYKMIYK